MLIIRFLFIAMLMIVGGANDVDAKDIRVSSVNEVLRSVDELNPGDVLLLEDGVYTDIKLIVTKSGRVESPIVIKAENAGKVSFSGDVKVELRGDYIVLEGVYFRNGDRSQGEWRSHGPGLVAIYGSHNRVTQCAFHAFDGVNSAYITTSLDDDGNVPQYCRIDHCSFTEKITFDQVINLNNTLRKTLKGEPAVAMYHRIDHCLFSNPKKPGNAGGGIRIGYWRKDYGRCLVDSCLFVRQDSEAEIVTSKSRENVYYNNTFINCMGTLNFRHGDNQVAINNFFIGNDHKHGYGGMFVWGSGHLIAANYFELSKTIKSRGNAALYLNPGAEGVEHALAYDINILNNVFKNTNGYSIHFLPLLDRRIKKCLKRDYLLKLPYDISINGNLFASKNSNQILFHDNTSHTDRNISWINNFSNTDKLGVNTSNGFTIVKNMDLEFSDIQMVNGRVVCPHKTVKDIKNVEGIDLELQILAEQGVTGKPIAEKQVGPNWLKTVPGSYFHTGRLSKMLKLKFKMVKAARRRK